MYLNTKQDFVDLLKQITAPAVKSFVEQKKHSGIQSNYGSHISELECFTRLCYGMAPLCVLEKQVDWTNFFNQKMKEGTDCNSAYYFGKLSDYDQKSVETIPLLLMLYLNRTDTWDTYTSLEKNRIVQWFACVNQVKLYECNWQFFGLVTNLILQLLAPGEFDPETERYWSKIDSWYLGDGWYGDGALKRIDYYCAWAFHFYSLLIIKLCPDYPHKDLIVERAILFSKAYIHFFDEDGRTIPYGRSLIYRFASSCFWSLLAVNKIYPIEPSVIKDLICGNLEWWMEQDMFDTAGCLTLGYAYPNQHLPENYSSWGSPYWALKTFLVLLAEDEFWKAKRQKWIPVQDLCCEAAGLTVRHFNHASTLYIACNDPNRFVHYGSKYNRFAYHSKNGFNLAKSMLNLRESGLESTLAFTDDGMHFASHDVNIESKYTAQAITHHWEVHDFGVISSVIIPLNGADHIRIHSIWANRCCRAYDFGYAYPLKNGSKLYRRASKNEYCFSTDDQNRQQIKVLRGHAVFRDYRCDVNLNLYHPHTAVPYAQFRIKWGKNVLIDVFLQDRPFEDYHIRAEKGRIYYELDGKKCEYKYHGIPGNVRNKVLKHRIRCWIDWMINR